MTGDGAAPSIPPEVVVAAAPVVGADRLLGPPEEVAAALLGLLVVRNDGRAVRLVEVEAYGGADDPASHAWPAPTPRSLIMAGPPGRLYVYLSYGLHRCANVVCSPPGRPAAVLLRAGEPVAGLEAMRTARWGGPPGPDRDLCRGPGRLGRALGLGLELGGTDLTRPDSPLTLRDDGVRPEQLVTTGRIGVSRAADRPWRYVVAGSRWASGPRATTAGA